MIFAFSVLIASTASAQSKKKPSAALPCGTEEQAVDVLSKLPEVKTRDRFIDSLTSHKHGISMINYDQGQTPSLAYYEINVGYSSDIRFENYYTFRVSKKDCSIMVEDIEDSWISLQEWRKREQEKD